MKKLLTLIAITGSLFCYIVLFSEEKFGSVNYSQAVRAIVREYYAKDKER